MLALVAGLVIDRVVEPRLVREDAPRDMVATDADTPSVDDVAQGGDDVEVRALVGDQVVGVEVAAALGELGDVSGEGRGRLDLAGAHGEEEQGGSGGAEEQAMGRTGGKRHRSQTL